MTDKDQFPHPGSDNPARWYDLFSRGARDWLRHNEKIQEAVQKHLPDVVSDINMSGDNGNRTVRIPVRFLEHYRFSLLKNKRQEGAGQGDGKPGEIITTGHGRSRSNGNRAGSDSGEGSPEFLLELKIDDIVDWFWETLNLPNLQAKTGTIDDDEFTREGWDKRGVRSRLDRRRTLKESIKRRAAYKQGPAFIDEDLRYRQLVRHKQPTTEAVVFFCLDVSSSMTEDDRKLAKSFFFWTLQGLRRQYRHISSVFVAHTVKAWEFSEQEFFQVTAHGGTVASIGFAKVKEIIEERYDPARFNIYVFYASDGENFPQDREPAFDILKLLAQQTSFIGYLETMRELSIASDTNTGNVFDRLERAGLPVGVYPLRVTDDVWAAIRGFFQHQAESSNG